MLDPMPRSAGVLDYLKRALLSRWNLLLLFGGATAALLSPWPDALLPLVGAGELLYLGGLISMPRFRQAVDAEVAAQNRVAVAAARPPVQSVSQTLGGLAGDAQQRFIALRRRCLEMRGIAQAGRSGGASTTTDLWTPALDRLLYGFLRLLVQQNSLRRFLASTSEQELSSRLDELKQKLTSAQATGEDRMIHSLQESVEIAEQRLDNYRKGIRNAEFAGLELDRVETKIQALIELAANRQDPDLLSSQVDAAAEGMHRTETALSQLQQVTGLADALDDDVPAILDPPARQDARDGA